MPPIEARPALHRLGDWQPATSRVDPITVLEAQAIDRLPWLNPIRYGRMARDVFAFYRGTAAVMAHDLGSSISSSLNVQLCGDCHVGNFGFHASPEIGRAHV